MNNRVLRSRRDILICATARSPARARARREADETGVDAAVELAAGFHIVERRRRCRACRKGGGGQGTEKYGFLHVILFLISAPTEGVLLPGPVPGGLFEAV